MRHTAGPTAEGGRSRRERSLTRLGALRELKTHLIDGQADDAHEVDAARAHGPIRVDAVDPAHRLHEPKTAARALALRNKVPRFCRRQRRQKLVIRLADDEGFLEQLQCKVYSVFSMFSILFFVPAWHLFAVPGAEEGDQRAWAWEAWSCRVEHISQVQGGKMDGEACAASVADVIGDMSKS